MSNWIRFLAALTAGLLGVTFLAAQSGKERTEHWVATWATAQELSRTIQEIPELPPGVTMPDFSKLKGPVMPLRIPKSVQDETVRMIVHTSIGGNRLRIELSNAFGLGIVSIADAHIAKRTSESSVDPASDRKITFSGNPGVEIRPGAVIVSDAINMDVKPMSDLAVSLYVAKSDGEPANHMVGLHTSYIAGGDTTASVSMSKGDTTTGYLWLRSIDVVAPPSSIAIACLGDSITDGFGTTGDANRAWPALLAKRLNQPQTGARISVLNEGISGNEILRDGAGVSALARFDRDILGEPGVRWIVLLEGINDINLHGQITGPVALDAEDLIAGYRQLIARAHLNGIKVIGATLTPEEGVWLAGPVGEATRQKVNAWIRNSGEFDAVVDFDAVVRDPNHPARLRTDLDPGDHIHPNDIGNQSMADAFALSTFER
jgi:lysophospholipase L1-like esterase